MRIRHACAAALAALVVAAIAGSAVSAQERIWDVAVKLAEKTMEPQGGWDFVPINDPANCLLLLEVALVYRGPAGEVPAPRMTVEDDAGRRHDAWGNTTCNMSDGPCFDAMGWVLSATHAKPETRTLSTGDTISTGSLTYYFEVPRASGTLRLRV